MNDLPESSIVKVLYRNGEVAGAGFLIEEKWVLTCKHVIENILSYNGSTLGHFEEVIDLTFYLDKSKKVLKSHILFLADEGEPDIAVLKLEEKAPTGVSIGKLVNTDILWDRKLKVCGFSSGEGGEWVSAVGRAKVDSNTIQMDVSNASAYNIEEGFSGAPVFDAEISGILGIVVSKEKGKFIGFFTPTELIVKVCKMHSVYLNIPNHLGENEEDTKKQREEKEKAKREKEELERKQREEEQEKLLKTDHIGKKIIIFSLLMVAVLIFAMVVSTISNKTDDLASNRIVSEQLTPPVANFSVDTTLGNAPLKVQFTDMSKNGTEYNWNLGDGFVTKAQNPNHTYTNAGNYTVELTVSNAAGKDTETKTSFITVAPTLPALVADFSADPTSGNTPLTVKFTDNSSGSPTEWKWNFGDGNTSSAKNPTHKYLGTGTYTVKETVYRKTISGIIEDKSERKSDYIIVM